MLMTKPSRHSSEATTRYRLSEAIVKASTILSGWNADDFIPSKTSCEDDTTVVPEAAFAKVENYLKRPKACKKAVNWLTLVTMWALQEGLSSILTKQIVEEHLGQFKHYISVDSATWDDFVHVFFVRHKIDGATQFVQWYRYHRFVALGRNIWFSYEELQRATNNFSRALKCAEGKSATVYKGIEQFSEKFIAIKRLKKVTDVSLRKALYEVAVNSYIKKSLTTNKAQIPLVNLLGFSPRKDDPLLVFEFIPNGNLRQHLQGQYGNHLHSHPSDRLRIAIDIASALRHLHFNCESPIYHRDVKSTNILLDTRYRGSLADVSNAKILRWSLENSIESSTTLYSLASMFGIADDDDNTSVIGSLGYVDPVVQQTHQWSDLSDVYSFGVVLLELATFLKAYDDSARTLRFLPDIVKETVGSGNLSALLQTKQGSPEGEALKQMLFLGMDCCSLDPTSRPRIDEVESILQHLLGELRASSGVS